MIQRSERTVAGHRVAAAEGEQGTRPQAAPLGQLGKAKALLARLHRRLGAIRSDAMHKLTTRITRTYAVIGIEDLNVRGMVRNRHLRVPSPMAAFTSFAGRSLSRRGATAPAWW